MSDSTTNQEVHNIDVDMVYRLNDVPSVPKSLFAALQHLMAIFVGIVTPPIIICGALGLNVEMTTFIINMALVASGISTFIQAKTFGPVGSGLLSIQGTSFTFLGAIISTGFAVKAAGGSPEAALATIFGVCFVGAFVEIIASRFLKYLKKVITPLVSGIVVTLIGMSLIKVGLTDIGGGQYVLDNIPDAFGTARNLILAAIVLVTIVFFNRSQKPMLRMGAIFIGLAVGYVISAFMGMVDFSPLKELPFVNVPVPFKYGFFKFNFAALVPFLLLYLITTVESIGDLTATSAVSGEPVDGPLYMKRISGGVMGDGINSAIAAVLNSFPNTTFSQNNGVIQMTGVASRHVAFFIAGLLVVVGMFPIVGGIFSIIPKPVLGGATIIMFGTVAASGIRIISTSIIDRRGVLIMAISFGLGLGVVFVPQIFQHAPEIVKQIFGSAITTGGLSAIFLNVVLPRSFKTQKTHENLQTDIS